MAVMGLPIRYTNPAAVAVSASVERLSDGTFYDFADSTFKAQGLATTLLIAVPADTTPFAGRNKLNITPTPQTQFTDGDYCVTIHNTDAANAVVAEFAVTMYGGSAATVFPTGVVGGGSLGFPVLAGSTITSVLLTVPAGPSYTSWRGRKLCRLASGEEAIILAVALAGTTLTVTLAPGWTAATTGEMAYPAA